MSPNRMTNLLTAWQSYVVILVVLAGATFYRDELRSSRPGVSDPHADWWEAHSVPARLWEDPFAAAQRHLEEHRHDKANPSDGISARLAWSKHRVSVAADVVVGQGDSAGEKEHGWQQVQVEIKRKLKTSEEPKTDQETIVEEKDSLEQALACIDELLHWLSSQPDDEKPAKAKPGYKLDAHNGRHAHKTDDAKQHLNDLKVLLVMTPGEAHAEAREHRIRDRYALQSALRASGYVAEDPEHIRFVKHDFGEHGDCTNHRHQESGDATHDRAAEDGRILIPYEWFRTDDFTPGAGDGSDGGPRRSGGHERHDGKRVPILVMWLADVAFERDPLEKLVRIARRIAASDSICADIDIIGPWSSTTMRAMLKEAVERGDDLCNWPANADGNHCVRILSRSVTAQPSLLCRELGWDEDEKDHGRRQFAMEDIERIMRRARVEYVPMICTDEMLVDAILNELELRGIDLAGGDHVALVSEWDTFYGRAFPITFATALERRSLDIIKDFGFIFDQIIRDGDMPDNLHLFSYMRGVDGIVPSGGSVAVPYPADAPTATEKGVAALSDLGIAERPSGENQLDYARRLADEMHGRFRGPNRGQRLRAIGVVGTDAFDKLLILEALRAKFDDVVFFTTDLDARFFYRDHYPYTRNLVVASSYGLRLNDDLQKGSYQGGASQFRDVYQTAMFLTCRVAVGLPVTVGEGRQERLIKACEVFEALDSPRVFEIGRDRAVDLSPASQRKKGELMLYADRSLGKPNPVSYVFYCAIIAVAGFVLVAVSSDLLRRVFSKKTSDSVTREKQRRDRSVFYVCISLGLALAAVIFYDHFWNEHGEPFSIWVGVSSWPGIIIRFAAVVVVVWKLFDARQELLRSDELIECRIWASDRKRKPKERRSKSLALRLALACALMRSPSPRKWHDGRRTLSAGNWTIDKGSIARLWAMYRTRERIEPRVARIMAASLTYGLLVLILLSMFGRPFSPIRGEWNAWANNLSVFAGVIAMVVFLMYAVDSTRLCQRFALNVGNLADADAKSPEQERWSKESLKIDVTRASPSKSRQRFIAEYLDVWLVAERTKVIQNIVVWSGAVILLMAAARVSIFDHWNVPLPLIVAFLLGFGYVVVALVQMQRAARRVRDRAIARLREKQLAVKGTASKDAELIESVIERIENINDGAYATYFSNPVFQTLLIPTGGLSLLTMVELWMSKP